METLNCLEDNEMATKKKQQASPAVEEQPKVEPTSPEEPIAATKVNKSALIRAGLNEYSDIGPTELAKILSERHGISVVASEVSNVRTAMRKAHGGVATPRTKAKGLSGGLVANLKAFHDAVQAVGGREEAAELLKILN